MYQVLFAKYPLIMTSALLICLLTACGSTPKEVDHDGLRERADQETSQVN